MKEIKDLLIKENVKMSEYTSYKTGGIAKYFVYPKTTEALQELMNFIFKNNIKYFVIGNGTNIIFTDEYYDGVVINLSKLDQIKIENTIIEVSSGYSLQKLVSEASKRGLSGLEFASGIPGTVGGATYMNAGAYGACIFEKIKYIQYLENGEIIKKAKEEIPYGYRYSYFKDNKKAIILSITIELSYEDKNIILDKIKEYTQKRIQTQPLEYPNAGSVFKNPETISAGALIDTKLNLKGKSVGGAYVSEKHANFIINKNNATSNDIIKLIEEIKKVAKQKENIVLQLEQEIIK